MATRVNMMKLLQEVRGLANFPSPQSEHRVPSHFAVQLRTRTFKATAAYRRRTLQIQMQDLPDIPEPVRIVYI